jgi:hypothetical protein
MRDSDSSPAKGAWNARAANGSLTLLVYINLLTTHEVFVSFGRTPEVNNVSIDEPPRFSHIHPVREPDIFCHFFVKKFMSRAEFPKIILPNSNVVQRSVCGQFRCTGLPMQWANFEIAWANTRGR